MSQEGTDARRDLRIELMGIHPRNLNTGELPGTTGGQMLTPKACKLHVCSDPLAANDRALTARIHLYSRMGGSRSQWLREAHRATVPYKQISF